MTLLMGIVNVTPDSFSDGGRHDTTDAALAHARALLVDGADIIDVGGESTRPGSERIAPAVEHDRVLPVVTELADAGVEISIDTLNASTAVAAVAAGARHVNDVSGGLADPELLPATAPTGATLIIGHWRGPSTDMYARAEYADIVDEVCAELAERVQAAVDAGFDESRLVVDPGFGFGKRGAQNLDLLRGLPRLIDAVGLPALVGTSRKHFLTAALMSRDADDVSLARRDAATAVTSIAAAAAGAWGVRVHDVTATRDALAVARQTGLVP